MNAISQSSATTMEWRDPEATEPRFELWFGEDQLASLEFVSPCRTLALAQTPEGTWSFRRTGFLTTLVHLREEGADQDFAVFRPGLLGRGKLTFGNGVTFHWRPAGRGTWSFTGEDGEVLLLLKPEAPEPSPDGPPRTQAEVEITAAGRFSPRVPLLAAMGWYLLLLHQQDQTAMAGTMELVF